MNPMKEFVDNHDKHVDENFDKFIDKHDKNYDSEDEKEKKKNAFRLIWNLHYAIFCIHQMLFYSV